MLESAFALFRPVPLPAESLIPETITTLDRIREEMPRNARRLRRILALLAISVSALWVSGCASSSGVAPRPKPFPRAPSPSRPAPERTPTPGAEIPDAAGHPRERSGLAVGDAVVDVALEYLGAPYRDGGADPSGFDCSGFVQFVYQKLGIGVARTVVDLFGEGRVVQSAEIQPGDLLFFATTTRGPSHVGIALGRGSFVHAPSSRGVVRVEDLLLPYWRDRFLGVRRFVNGEVDHHTGLR